MLDYFVIALFAFVGGSLRYWIGLLLPKIGVFPVGTLVSNLIGCFIFSWLVKHILSDRDISGRLILGLGVGFCGALTTFSSFALDTAQLMQAGQWSLAFLYLFLSFTGGLVMTYLGEAIYRKGVQTDR